MRASWPSRAGARCACSTPANCGPAPISNPTPMIEPASRQPATVSGQESAPAADQAPVIDAARQETARAYAGISRRLFFVELGLGALLLIAFLVSGLSAGLR